MHRFKFTPDDLFVNRLKTYPEYSVFVYEARAHINRVPGRLGGSLFAYELNNNAVEAGVIPYVVSGSEKTAFKIHRFQPLVQNYSGDHFNISKYAAEHHTSSLNSFYGETFASVRGEIDLVLTSSYTLGVPITRNLTSRESTFRTQFYNISSSALDGATITYVKPLNVSASALQNVARKYTLLSDHFIFTSSSIRSRDLVYGAAGDNINFINIPSMYYGSTIKKGSVELNFFITGSKLASCADINHNGTLIGTTGSTSGSVVGLVLYDEGVIMLTSSSEIDLKSGFPAGYEIHYNGASEPAVSSSWQYFGVMLNDGIGHSKNGADRMSVLISYEIKFKGHKLC